VTRVSAQRTRSAPGFVSLLALLSISCLGDSDDAPQTARVPSSDAASEDATKASGDAGTTPIATAPEPLGQARDDDAAPPHPPIETNLRLGHAARFEGYLMDRDQQPLYMFAGDVAGSGSSACLDACAQDWPPFDLPQVEPDPGILANELTRFHRQDGSWQTAYKGHPLYYRAAEAGAREITGDGLDARWFIARDYLAFVGMDASFAPAGSERFGTAFLTNGFGRALYVCLDDTPGGAENAPVSACMGECARRHPLWSVSEAGRTTILPSVLGALDLAAFERPDGAVQLALRGWPLYYFSGDERPGDVNGQNQNAWRAIDPLHFAKEDGAPNSQRGVQAMQR
jgi:predicted lipoprotein with Yx(FWY)xxD motif